MKPLILTNELARVARRTVWFEPPIVAIADPVRFTAYVLTYGTHEDVEALRQYVSDEDLAEAIHKAPPGIFDARSWTYWNLKVGHHPALPMPHRTFK